MRVRKTHAMFVKGAGKSSSSDDSKGDKHRRSLQHGSKECSRGDRFLLNFLTSVLLCIVILTPVCCARSVQLNGDQSLKPHCRTTEITGSIGYIDNVLLPCFNTAHRQVFPRIYKINAPRATRITIFIERSQLLSVSNDRTSNIDLDIGKIEICYGDDNVIVWNGTDSQDVFVIESSLVTVKYTGSLASFTKGVFQSSKVAFSYSAVIPDSFEGAFCSEDVNQEIHNGFVTVTRRSLGSRARVQCKHRYMFDHVVKDPVCRVRNGKLEWEFWRGKCVPECSKPEPIDHGAVLLKDAYDAETKIGFYGQTARRKTTEKTNSSILRLAEYSCDIPYILEGAKWSFCELDNENKPIWTNTRRRCVIPSCSNPIILREMSGAMVHPDYPQFMETFRPINCQWRITMRQPSIVDFKFKLLDLPDCPESVIKFISTTPPRPRLLASFTNNSDVEEKSFSVKTSGLLVTYQHPSGCHVTQHRGLYITYQIRPHTRTRRDAPAMARQKNTSESSSQEPLPPTPQTFRVSPTHAPADKDDQSGSSNSWKIAVGVVIPILIILIILFIAYKIYRKKFPVRMILGREFGKFRNPSYNPRRGNATLVREDAADMFARNSQYNPEMKTSDYKIPCDNPGFVGDDEVDCENEEERADREFRSKKSWLFKTRDSDDEDGGSRDEDGGSRDEDGGAGTVEDSETPKEDLDETDERKKGKVASEDDKEFSDDSDIEAMLQEQKVTPRPKRKEISESEPSISSSSSDLQTEANATEKDSSHSFDRLDETGQVVRKRSSFIEIIGPIYEQPTVEEVRAQMKARARSMSVDRPPPSPRPRSSSVQVDPSKSARRMSHNEALDSRTKTDLLKFVQTQKITASVVGVSFLTEYDAATSCSMSSINSNSHITTDLDDSTDDDAGNQKIKIIITSDETEMRDSGMAKEEMIESCSKENEEEQTGSIETADPSSREPENRKIQGKDVQGNENDQSDEVIREEIKQVDNDAISVISTSGSSSSSDTHFEEHHASMTKPVFLQQSSFISASSDTAAENLQDEIKDEVKKEIDSGVEIKENENTAQNKENVEVTRNKTELDSQDTFVENRLLEKSDPEITDEESTDHIESSNDLRPALVSSEGTEPMAIKHDINASFMESSPSEGDEKDKQQESFPGTQNNSTDMDDLSRHDVEGKGAIESAEHEKRTLDVRSVDTSTEGERLTSQIRSDYEQNENQKKDSYVYHAMPAFASYVSEQIDSGSGDKKTITFVSDPKETKSSPVPSSDSNSDTQSMSDTDEPINRSIPDSQIRVIGGIEFSDVSSDSSDVLEDNEVTATKKKKPLKKISFRLKRDFDDDDGYSDDDSDGDNNNKESNKRSGEDNQRTRELIQDGGGGECSEKMKEETTGSLSFVSRESGLLLQRDISSTDSNDRIDAYNEFADENVDRILQQESEHTQEADTFDSNSNVTSQRTIGIDPEVKFSFQDASRITLSREDSEDDDIDI